MRRLSSSFTERAGFWRGLAAAGLGLAIVVAAVVYQWQQREEALDDAGREMQNVALVVGNWVESDFHAIELVESGVTDWLREEGVGTAETFRGRLAALQIHEALANRIAALPRVRGLFLADAAGKVIVSSSAWPADSVDIAGRDYFQALRDDPRRDVVVSGALHSLLDDRWTIYLARKIKGADGGFLGVVVAGVELAYFETAFSRLELGSSGTIALYRRDGMLLARHPHLEARVGMVVPADDPLQSALQSSARRAMRRVSPLDGVDRMIGARLLRDYPLYLVSTRSVAEALAPWRRDVGRWAAGGGMLEILLGCGVLIVNRLAALRERERAARLSEYQTALSAVFDNGTAGLAETEAPSGRFLRVNDRYCEMTGRTAAELIGRTPADISLPEDRELLIRQWREALTGAGRADVEVRGVRPDGTVIWCRVSIAISARDAAGRPTRALSIVEDVTEAKLALERLRASEALLRLGMEIGHIGAFDVDLVTDRIRGGAGALALLGLPAEETPETLDAWLLLLAPDDRERVRRQVADALARRLPEVGAHFRVVQAGDKARHVEARFRLEYSAAGRPVRAFGVIFDVTAAHEAEEMLRLSLRAGEVGAFRHDHVAGSVDCGADTRAMFGLPQDGVAFTSAQWYSFILEEDRPKVLAQLAAVSPTQACEVKSTFRLRRPADGVLRYVEARAHYSFTPGGRPLSAIGVLIDVTEAREAEALRKLTLEVGGIGTFRHDFLTDRVECSPEARAMYGLPAGEDPLTADEWWGAILPEDLQALRARIARGAAGGNSESNARFRVRHLVTGALRRFETRVRLEYASDGSPISALGVIIDVTAAEQAEALSRMTLEVGGIGSFRHDMLTDLITCSPEAREICGLPPGEAPLSARTWWSAVVPEDLLRLKAQIDANSVARHAEEVMTFRVRNPGGGALRHVEARVRREYAPNGRPLCALGVIIDVTAAREADALRQLGLEAGRIGAFRLDAVAGLVECSPEARAMYGFPQDGRPLTVEQWWSPIVAEDRDRLALAVAAASREHDVEGVATFRIHHRESGALRHFEARTRRQYDAQGNLSTALGVVIDVTERREAEARIAHLAHHDGLTGLPNRALFRERLETALARAQRGHGCAVLLIDLDRFKEVNDTLGHPAGDALLREAVTRLQAELRDTDTLARLGGDEFAIVASDATQPQSVTALGERIIAAIARPFEIEGRQVRVGASLGVAIAPSDGLDPDALVKAADMALYRAKGDGRGCLRFFERGMDARMQERLALETDMRRALTAGEFEVFFQPIVDVRTRRVLCLEALLRWRHPERGLVPPDAFIPLAEDIGLIVPLGEWVLAEACAEAATWPGRPRVAVNLSPVQFSHAGLVLAVAAALGRSGLAPDRLELEITETVMLHDTQATLAVLEQLKTLGVRIAMDDFGTGYSSLSYLQRFPFDKVKIDRSFTRGLGQSRQSEAIVRAVTGMCAGLEMISTAEGVETEAQLAALHREGCAEAQGFLFSRPLPAAEIPALLRRLDLAA